MNYGNETETNGRHGNETIRRLKGNHDKHSALQSLDRDVNATGLKTHESYRALL